MQIGDLVRQQGNKSIGLILSKTLLSPRRWVWAWKVQWINTGKINTEMHDTLEVL